MIRWGRYQRKDVRLECGRVLKPLWVQRWRCAQHGTCSFLPAFLSRYSRYLVETIGKVCDWMCRFRRVGFPDEVVGPCMDTGRRWYRVLCSPEVERWLLRRLAPRTCSANPYIPARIVELARAYATQLKIEPHLYPRLLQSSRFAVSDLMF